MLLNMSGDVLRSWEDEPLTKVGHSGRRENYEKLIVKALIPWSLRIQVLPAVVKHSQRKKQGMQNIK